MGGGKEGVLYPTCYQLKASRTQDYLWFDQGYTLFQYCSVLGMPATISDSMPQWSSPRRILKKPGRTSRAKSQPPRHATKKREGEQCLGVPHRCPPSQCSRSWPPASTECRCPRPSPGAGSRGHQLARRSRAGRHLHGNTATCQHCNGHHISPRFRPWAAWEIIDSKAQRPPEMVVLVKHKPEA